MISITLKFVGNVCQGLCTGTNTGLPNVTAGSDQLSKVLQIVFGIIGAVALIWVIIAGLQFVTSQGDPQATAKARQTIIYAIIGLVIALSAEVIVKFVLGRVGQ